MGHAIVAGGARANVPVPVPVAGILLGDIAVGSIVKLNENGSPVEFYVAKHDYESGLNGTGRTLLVRKDVYEYVMWNSARTNTYKNSTIDTWLNETYKPLMDSLMQNLVETTGFYYTPGNGSNSVSTLQRAIFVLSAQELGKSSIAINSSEGSALPISGVLAGLANTQWTRTPILNDAGSVCILRSGALESSSTSMTYGVRPCFTLTAGAIFDSETMEFKGVA